MGILSRLFGGRSGSDRIPDSLWDWVIAQHPIFGGLSADESRRLRETSGRFLSTRQFLPDEGVSVDERLYLSIACQACLPILELDLRYYRGWSTIVLAKDEFRVESSETDEAGVVHESDDQASGEFLALGSIILSVPDIDASGWGDGYNVVIHEMAHVLDRGNGALDGSPALHRGMEQRAWTEAFIAAYTDFQQSVECRRRPRARSARSRDRIDPYAAESPEEFFAVLSELFFETPRTLVSAYPAVYHQLSLFYRQDPVRRRP